MINRASRLFHHLGGKNAAGVIVLCRRSTSSSEAVKSAIAQPRDRQHLRHAGLSHDHHRLRRVMRLWVLQIASP
jgi:hypothetical protein